MNRTPIIESVGSVPVWIEDFLKTDRCLLDYDPSESKSILDNTREDLTLDLYSPIGTCCFSSLDPSTEILWTDNEAVLLWDTNLVKKIEKCLIAAFDNSTVAYQSFTQSFASILIEHAAKTGQFKLSLGLINLLENMEASTLSALEIKNQEDYQRASTYIKPYLYCHEISHYNYRSVPDSKEEGLQLINLVMETLFDPSNKERLQDRIDEMEQFYSSVLGRNIELKNLNDMKPLFMEYFNTEASKEEVVCDMQAIRALVMQHPRETVYQMSKFITGVVCLEMLSYFQVARISIDLFAESNETDRRQYLLSKRQNYLLGETEIRRQFLQSAWYGWSISAANADNISFPKQLWRALLQVHIKQFRITSLSIVTKLCCFQMFSDAVSLAERHYSQQDLTSSDFVYNKILSRFYEA